MAENIKNLDSEMKLVRGIWYNDGIPYRRWMLGYRQDGTWFVYDSADIIHEVETVLELSKLDKILS